MTMESNKSYDLPFVHWRPRRATDIVPVLSWEPEEPMPEVLGEQEKTDVPGQ